MLLLRDAIRHSATAAAKRSEDSRYRIEPRVQVYSHPFKQRLEPRVHLAGQDTRFHQVRQTPISKPQFA